MISAPGQLSLAPRPGAPRAAIYARISDRDEEQCGSVPAQLEACRAECARLGYEVVGEFSDRKSGATRDRPGWRAVEALIAGRALDLVVVKNRSRIVREDFLWGLIERELLRPHGVSVHPLMGLPDAGDDPVLRLALKMEAVTNAFTVELARWEALKTMRRLAEAGLWRSAIPYGCRKGAVRGIPERDPATWPAVVLIFELAGQGLPVFLIQRELSSRGIPSPKGRPQWTYQQLRDLLAREFYCGRYSLHGVEYELKHQCRVPLHLWDAAQQPRSQRGRGGRPSAYCYLLAGLVVTDEWLCTGPPALQGKPVPLHAKWVNGRGGVKHHYYYRADLLRHCGGVQARPARASAARLRASVRADDLERAVVEELIERTRGGMLGVDCGQLAAGDRQAVGAEVERLQARAASLRAKLAQARSRLGAAFVEGGQVLVAVRELADKLAAELAAAEHELGSQRSLADALDQSGADSAYKRRRLDLVEELWATGERELLRELLRAVVDSVIVRTDSVVLRLRLPVCASPEEWVALESNQRPHPYQGCALTD